MFDLEYKRKSKDCRTGELKNRLSHKKHRSMVERRGPPCLALTLTLMVSVTSLARASSADKSELLSRPINDILLEQHNTFRQQEKASNIYQMHWNKSVEQAASAWASQCQFKHKLSGAYGENLFYSSDPSFEDFDIREILLGGMELWHDEKRGWRYTKDTCGAACHYTQLVWASTTSVGCAHQMCHGLKVGRRSVDRALYLVCFYYPRGNWVGEYPFKMGGRCADCGSDSCQKGLCVEETSSFSSFHTESGNKVQSGSTLNWNYSAKGADSHRQEHKFQNISSVTSRDPRQNGFRHSSASHSRHDVNIRTPAGHHSRRTSSSVYRVSRTSHSRQGAQHSSAQTGRLRSSSGGSLERERQSYSPSRAAHTQRLQNAAPAGLRQSPSHARHAPAAPERINSRIGSSSSHSNYNSQSPSSRSSSSSGSSSNRSHYTRGVPRDASGRGGKSPLDVIREDNHWCRDRLPSCRIWTGECERSKAVSLSCPRTCGHCGKKKESEEPRNALQERPRHSSTTQPSPYTSTTNHHLRRSHHHHNRGPQPRTPARHQQQRPYSQHRQSQHIRLQQQQRKPDPTSQPQRNKLLPRSKQTVKIQPVRQRQRQFLETRRGRKKAAAVDKERKRKTRTRAGKRPRKGQQQRQKGQRKGPRPRKGPRQGQRRLSGKRRRPAAVAGRRRDRVRDNRRQRHKKFQTVDQRAELLASKMRKKTLDKGRCEDDPKYTRSCPVWVKKGFCEGNVLVSNVYCKRSCGSC